MLDLLFGTHIPSYNRTLTRFSPIYDLSHNGGATSSIVRWDAITPAGTTMKVYSSISMDGSTWSEWTRINNDTNLNEIYGKFLSLIGCKIKFKQELFTSDILQTPVLKSFGIYFENTSSLNYREEWQIDTRLLGKFNNSLEAGNIENRGIKIIKFAIKRRRYDEIEDTILAYLPFVNNAQLKYYDYSQGNFNYIYSVVPIGENFAEGTGNSLEIESTFAGYYLVDVENDIVIPFNKSFNDLEMVDTNLNQGRTQIDTFSQYPRYFYNNQKYHAFSLSTVLIPDENQKSYQKYGNIESLIRQNKPLLAKGSNGSLFAVDASNLRISNPQNTYKAFDYAALTLDCVEIMSYKEYLKENVKNVSLDQL